MEDEQGTIPVSPHLKNSVAALGVAILCVLASLVLTWEWTCVLWLLMSVVLLYGWISAFAGLSAKSNRRGLRRWGHIGVIVAIPILWCLANFFSLVDLRMRLAVASNGGRNVLQTWAVALLDKPRDGMDGDGDDWIVPEEDWSEQVRRLKPCRVYIKRVFENGGEGICLPYGSGFFHWWIVIGRPGSRPDPQFNDPNSDDRWLRWADGIYDWQQG